MSAVPTPSGWPRPLTWTADQFNDLGDRGLFEGRRALLLDGVIWEQGPMEPIHAGGIGLADLALRAAFDRGWTVCCQLPINLDRYSSVSPDLDVRCGGPREWPRGHPTTAPLVVEVADSTLAFDTTVKAERYATAGVPDYWVIDLMHRCVHVFRDPRPDPANPGTARYRQRMTVLPADTIAPLAAPGATVAVADLLP